MKRLSLGEERFSALDGNDEHWTGNESSKTRPFGTLRRLWIVTSTTSLCLLLVLEFLEGQLLFWFDCGPFPFTVVLFNSFSHVID